MNIAIIDADLIGRKKHRFPNLASMKLSSYNKSIGNKTRLITDYRDLFSKYIELDNKENAPYDFIMFEIVKNKTRYFL